MVIENKVEIPRNVKFCSNDNIENEKALNEDARPTKGNCDVLEQTSSSSTQTNIYEIPVLEISNDTSKQNVINNSADNSDEIFKKTDYSVEDEVATQKSFISDRLRSKDRKQVENVVEESHAFVANCPSNYNAAKLSNNWKTAMDEEINSLKENETYLIYHKGVNLSVQRECIQ